MSHGSTGDGSPATGSPAFRVLRRQCHEQVHDLALFRYCVAGCLTCPHEGRRGSPSRQATFDAYGKTRHAFSGPDALGLNPRLPEQVEAWLAETPPAHRPPFVTLGIYAEALPGFESSTDVVLRAVGALLRAGVRLSLRTRRNIPDHLLDLLARHADLVWATLPLPTLEPATLRIWEPGTGSPSQRLYAAQRLLAAGIATQVLVHPIIPYVTDGRGRLEAVVNAAADVGVRQVGASFLRLRPVIRRRLDEHAPVSTRLLYGAYLRRGPDGDRQAPLPPREHRLTAYRALASAARHRGVHLGVCRCLDLEIGRGPCFLWPGEPADRAPQARPRRPAASDARPHSPARGRRRQGQVGIDDLLEK